MQKHSTPCGLVLAGGKSTRLGLDKVGLNYSGQVMLSRMVKLARSFCKEVYVSGRNPAELGVNAPWMADAVVGIGPMGGILTALKELQRDILVLACDLPLLDKDTIEALLKAHRSCPAGKAMTTFLQSETGYIEALVAVYTPAAIPLLEHAVQKNIYKLSRAIPEEMRHHLTYSRDKAGVFFNINFPADLAMLRQVEAVRAARGLTGED